MLTINQLLGYDYDTLILLIKDRNPIMDEALKNIKIKEKLIKINDKNKFYELLREIDENQFIQLFDNQAVELLKNSLDSNDKINALLTINNKLATCILKNDKFCSLVVDRINNLFTSIKHLEIENAKMFLDYVKKNNKELLEKTILYLSFPAQEEVLKEYELPINVKKKLLPYVGGRSKNHIFKNTIGINLNDYDFPDLYNIFSSRCQIPIIYLEDKELVTKLTTMYSIKDFRFLIDALTKNNDSELINKKRKEYYNKELISYDQENQMLKRYSLCYKDLCKLIDENNTDYENLEEVLKKHFNFFGIGEDEIQLRHYLCNFLATKDKEKIKEFLINESNIQMSNMIIDYHFEDISYNFLLDVEELYRFQTTEGRTLNDEELKIYEKLLNIDKLSYEEKMDLHKKLLQNNWIEKHYDIFREAKDKSVALIKEQMLNEENIEKYLDKQKTEKYGVPIYVLDGEEFYAFVKALPREKLRPLTQEDMISTVDGGSYSLDGSNKLNTYHDPHYVYNLIFSDFPSNQIVHMHLVDSFSKYVRTSDTKPTNRVNELLTPKELIENLSSYNEIILSQRNSKRENDEVNDRLGLPKLLGIYCYDEFYDIDVDSARDLGIGIVVVKTKSYDTKNANQDHIEHLMMSISDSKQYLTDIRSDDIGKRRGR